MAVDQLAIMFITAVVTGGVSAIATVAGLRVHIEYLRAGQGRNEKAIARAHDRIDAIEKRA